MSDHLDLALRTLARELVTPEPSPDLAARVADRVRGLPVPRRTVAARLRAHTAWLVAALVALLVTTLAVSPVGATVAEWFGFHGVMVREDDSDLTGEPVVPGEPTGLTLDEAADLTGFRPLLPEPLGAPDGIRAKGNLVSLSWETPDTVRLDQFLGSLEPNFWKTAPDAVRVDVDGRDALWFPTAHEVVVVVPDTGVTETLAPRLAAPTLVWVVGDLTLRLEGDLTLREAVGLAESTG